MKRFYALTAALLAILTISQTRAANRVVDGFVLAPSPTADFMGAHEGNDPFSVCPVYKIETIPQISLFDGWKGKEDFSARLRVAWSPDAIFWRFDIIDDIPVTDQPTRTGDQFSLYLSYLTAGPVQKRGPHERRFDILTFYPNVKKESCRVKINSSAPARFGKIKTRLFQTLEGYSVLVSMPTKNWEDKPRFGSIIQLQAVFDDIDTPVNAAPEHHRLLLFPVTSQQPGAIFLMQNFGKLKTVGRSWVRITANGAIQPPGKARLLLNYGNLNHTDQEAEIQVVNEKTQKQIENAGITRILRAGEHKMNVPIEIDLSKLPPGYYRFQARTGIYFDNGYVKIRRTRSLGYCPNLIELRSAVKTRPLSILETRDGRNETFRYLAGGGTVLWNAGQYDASSNEFPQRIRRPGAKIVRIPEAKPRDIPWALFGPRDNLDKMAEPLIIKLPPEFGASVPPIRPNTYGSDDIKLKRKRLQCRRLLLLGVYMDYFNADMVPEIRVSTPTRPILQTRLAPSKFATIGSRHSFILRIWLKSGDQEIRIENIATCSHRLEIDFICLLGGGEPTEFHAGENAIRFQGNDEAILFGKELATSLFFMRHYLVDKNGMAYASLPGGSHPRASLLDYGKLMSELAAWNCTDEAKRLITRANEYTTDNNRVEIGNMETILGMYQTWKEEGRPHSFLSRATWINAIHHPITELGREVRMHPLGLISSQGEFGSLDEQPVASVPMIQTSQAALLAAAQMARAIGYDAAAESWTRIAEGLNSAFQKYCVVPKNPIKIADDTTYPESWGLPAQMVVALLPQNMWIYGLHDDQSMMLYNKNIRTFDTPYLLAGLPGWVDRYGFSLDPEMKKQLQASLDYMIAFSPIFQNSSWTQNYLLDYKSSELQEWMVLATLLLDNPTLTANLLTPLIQYTYDEGVPLRTTGKGRADIEVSPFTFEEKLNASDDGTNTGASYDELNARNGAMALKISRVIAGIDDSKATALQLIPRLPDGWNRVDVTDWKINHTFEDSATTQVTFTYERLSPRRYHLHFSSDEGKKLREIKVRIGPFDFQTRRVRLTNEGRSENIRPIRDGIFSWVTRVYHDVKTLDLTAQGTGL